MIQQDILLVFLLKSTLIFEQGEEKNEEFELNFIVFKTIEK